MIKHKHALDVSLVAVLILLALTAISGIRTYSLWDERYSGLREMNDPENRYRILELYKYLGYEEEYDSFFEYYNSHSQFIILSSVLTVSMMWFIGLFLYTKKEPIISWVKKHLGAGLPG